jgi:hypothetical protein
MTPSLPRIISPQGRAVPLAQLHRALDDRDAHRRQRELVRLSLVARPSGSQPTHRRWAAT